MVHLTRKLVSLLSIVAMVFAQMAVAAYACPMQFQGLDNAVAKVSASAADAGESDSASPALCKRHCENEQQNVNDSPQAPAAFSFETALTLTLPLVMQSATLRDAPVTTPSLRNATAPPLSIRHCCFRI